MLDKNDVLKKFDLEIEEFIEETKAQPSEFRMKKLAYYTALRNGIDIMPMAAPTLTALYEYNGYLNAADKTFSAYVDPTDNDPDYTELSFRFVNAIYSESRMNKLYERMCKENEAFKQDLLQMSQSEIYDKAYEITMKNDILMLFEGDDVLPCRKIDTLLSFEYPLDAIYDEWLDTDCSHMDMLRDSMDNLIDEQDEYLQKQDFSGDKTQLEDIAVWNVMYEEDRFRCPGYDDEKTDGEDMDL